MDFSKHGGDTQTILKLIDESLFKKFYLSYSEKCPSEQNEMCPSEHKVSFRTLYSKIVLPNLMSCIFPNPLPMNQFESQVYL